MNTSGEPRLDLRRRVLYTAAAFVVVLLVSTEIFFFFRDNFATHYPVKSLTAEILARGELPLWDPFSGGGQPLAGNPNYLTFYPTTLLYLAFPAHVAFTAHFLLHLALGAAGVCSLLRYYGVGFPLAVAGGFTYVLTGPVVSTTSFYNLVVVAGLTPWAVLFLEQLLADDRDRLRPALRLGAVAGLIGLSGEPVTVALVATLLLLVWGSRSMGRPAWLGLSLAVASIIVSPMIFAWSEVSNSTERSVLPRSPSETLLASLPPTRLPEIITGPPGWTIASVSSSIAESLNSERSDAVLFTSVFLGVLFVPGLLLGKDRPSTIHRTMFLLALFLAAGRHNPILAALVEAVGGLPVRYPQKAMLVAALSATVLSFLFLERSLTQWKRWLSAIAGVVVLGFVVFTFGYGGARGVLPWGVAALGLGAIGLTVFADSTRLRIVAAMLNLFALALIVPIAVPVDDADLWAAKPLPAEILSGGAIVSAASPDEEGMVPTTLYRRYAERLEEHYGVRFGIAYPLSRSGEGMFSWLSRVESDRYRIADRRDVYEQIAGISHSIGPGETVLTDGRGNVVELPFGIETRDRLTGYRSPSNVTAVAGVNEAIGVIESEGFDPAEDVVIQREGAAAGGAKILSVATDHGADRVEILSERPAVIVTPHTWFPAWQVGVEGGELETFPAYVDQLAFVVPPGRSIVSIEFSPSRPTHFTLWIASTVAVVCSLFWGVLGYRERASAVEVEPERVGLLE